MLHLFQNLKGDDPTLFYPELKGNIDQCLTAIDLLKSSSPTDSEHVYDFVSSISVNINYSNHKGKSSLIWFKALRDELDDDDVDTVFIQMKSEDIIDSDILKHWGTASKIGIRLQYLNRQHILDTSLQVKNPLFIYILLCLKDNPLAKIPPENITNPDKGRLIKFNELLRHTNIENLSSAIDILKISTEKNTYLSSHLDQWIKTLTKESKKAEEINSTAF